MVVVVVDVFMEENTSLWISCGIFLSLWGVGAKVCARYTGAGYSRAVEARLQPRSSFAPSQRKRAFVCSLCEKDANGQ